jgi:hypothetical protein
LPVVEVVAVALDHVVKHRDERLAAGDNASNDVRLNGPVLFGLPMNSTAGRSRRRPAR